MSRGVVRPGGYADDDPPLVDLTTHQPRPPRSAAMLASPRPPSGSAPPVIPSERSIIPHAVPPEVPLPYGEASAIGVRSAFGGVADPSSGTSLWMQIGAAGVILWALSRATAASRQ